MLISGVGSGLGKFFLESIPCSIGIFRDADIDKLAEVDFPYRAIIHCAANARVNPDTDLYQFINDNVLLTEKLTRVPHQKFIYMSSVDVYPAIENKIFYESDFLKYSQAKNSYAKSKLLSESIICNLSESVFILRLSALLGIYMRRNNLIRLLFEVSPSLSLTESSQFNLISYDEILQFINLILNDRVSEDIYNLASSQSIDLGSVAKIFCKEVEFGEFEYKAPLVSNLKASQLVPSFKESSESKIAAFLQEKISHFA